MAHRESFRRRHDLLSWKHALVRLIASTILVALAFSPQQATAASGSASYTYDALGRVTSASYDTGVIVIYSYDANGNRSQKVVSTSTFTLIWAASGTCPGQNCWSNTGSPVW